MSEVEIRVERVEMLARTFFARQPPITHSHKILPQLSACTTHQHIYIHAG
jgi:hypothetical protein